jgi:hypothetical protein
LAELITNGIKMDSANNDTPIFFKLDIQVIKKYYST